MATEVKPDPAKPILHVTKIEQYRTVDDLLARSKPSSTYYTYLMLSALIVGSGLLLGNDAVVIGGMLVTPLLTPVLAIALSIAVGAPKGIQRLGMLVFKSFLVVIIVSFVLGLLFESQENLPVVANTVQVTVLYLIVAMISGAAATFAWVRKEIVEILPGVAIAVTLVPPLSLIGVGLSSLSITFIRFYFFIVISNFLGIVMGSLVVFSLLKFHKSQDRVEKEIKKEEKLEEKKKEEKKEEIAQRDKIN